MISLTLVKLSTCPLCKNKKQEKMQNALGSVSVALKPAQANLEQTFAKTKIVAKTLARFTYSFWYVTTVIENRFPHFRASGQCTKNSRKRKTSQYHLNLLCQKGGSTG